MEYKPTNSIKDLADYWESASTIRGKARLTARVRFKRFAWKTVISATQAFKRVFDLAVSAIALIALSPIYAITALCIAIEDPGPVIFRQKRIGLKGRPFLILKFRSMIVDAEAVAQRMIEQKQATDTIQLKLAGDPRITRVGRFIRKYSIDELPQFWNVFKGDMSIVGPRPVVPSEVAVYSVEERQRLLAKPGLTCFWQVGGRADLDFENQVLLDVQYIRSTNLWLDFKLLLLTVPAVLLGKGAY